MQQPNNLSAPSFLIITLGCAKNEVDSDRMRSLLLADGCKEVAVLEAADVVLINTCSFLASATQESIECTLDLAERRHQGVKQRPIIMCGCVPSRYGKDLPCELPEVAAFVRTDEEDAIVDVVHKVLGIQTAHTTNFCAHTSFLRTIQATSAYVKISDGCDRCCAFCAIPSIRGRYYSRPLDEILNEVLSLVQAGVREIVFIGQDTGVWGRDLKPGLTLSDLLRRTAELISPYNAWIRVLYLQPDGMTEDLIETIAAVPEVLPYIDIPIQHCSERVLARMGRPSSPAKLRELFLKLKRRIPGIVLRTTAMAGFPGETDDEADELVAFLQEIGFDYVSVFSFSPEEGTKAAAMSDQIPEPLKLERAQRFQDTAELLGFAATAAHVGEQTEVIVDGVEEGPDGPELIGHTWFQAPDSDGAVHLLEDEAQVGDKLLVELVDASCYELYGRVVKSS